MVLLGADESRAAASAPLIVGYGWLASPVGGPCAAASTKSSVCGAAGASTAGAAVARPTLVDRPRTTTTTPMIVASTPVPTNPPRSLRRAGRPGAAQGRR